LYLFSFHFFLQLLCILLVSLLVSKMPYSARRMLASKITYSAWNSAGRIYPSLAAWHFNPLSPNSDENEFSLYIITTCSKIKVMRIKKVITKDKMCWYLDKFSLLNSIRNVWRTVRRIRIFISGLKGLITQIIPPAHQSLSLSLHNGNKKLKAIGMLNFFRLSLSIPRESTKVYK